MIAGTLHPSRLSGRISRRSAGFTLIEAVMVIVVTGIVSVATSVFVAGPVRSYFDTVRRAMLADTADTALRRFARDIEGAVPNSVRVTTVSGVTFVEFVPTVSAAHYRSAPDPAGTGPTLDFTASGTSFEIIGPYDTPPSPAQAVIFNLGPGVTSADVYVGTNRRTITLGASNVMNYVLAGSQFPLASPSDRFYVVNGAATYVCDPVGGTFARYTGYAIQSAQPTSVGAAPLSTATRGVLASSVSSCAVSYTQTWQSRSLVAVSMTLTNSGEAVSFYQEVHVPNVP